MGFLKKLFGGDKKSSDYVDTRGIYFYARCDNCGTVVKIRADKEYDLAREGSGYSWHKTIVDNRCFRAMPTVVILDAGYEIISAEISGGEYVSAEDYEAYLEEQARQAAEEADEEE